MGNFPGVTVDKKEGVIRDHTTGEHHFGPRAWGHERHKRSEIPPRAPATVVDLPGIYSLSPYTSEEIVTRDFLIDGRPDGIINIVDATNIERNLYLTMQLMELDIPMVIALNMMDEVRAQRRHHRRERRWRQSWACRWCPFPPRRTRALTS